MKKSLSFLLVFITAIFTTISSYAQELKPYQDTELCCYVRVGGTYAFQDWAIETSYKIEDETIATIDEYGVIHGIAPGETTMDVVVFDEQYAHWYRGGYSFDQKICVYEADSVLTLGSNLVEEFATFTPDESGYYSFTGEWDLITVSDGIAEYYPSADFRDDMEYYPKPDCYLKAGVTYTVRTSDYDAIDFRPVAKVIIKKTVPKISSLKEKNGAVKIDVKNTFCNRYGDVVLSVLRRTADTDFEIIGYLDTLDRKYSAFLDTDVVPGETYIYTLRLVDGVNGSEFLSGFDEKGKSIAFSGSGADSDIVAPETGDNADPRMLAFLCILSGAVILCLSRKKEENLDFTNKT